MSQDCTETICEIRVRTQAARARRKRPYLSSPGEQLNSNRQQCAVTRVAGVNTTQLRNASASKALIQADLLRPRDSAGRECLLILELPACTLFRTAGTAGLTIMHADVTHSPDKR